MIRTSKTEFVLLGLLANRPRTGYDLKKTIETQMSHFWKESFGQIYPVLSRMADGGLVRCEQSIEEGRPVRKIYTITEEGLDRLEEWLKSPFQEVPQRNELLLRIFFGKRASREILEGHLREYRGTVQNNLVHLERTEKSMKSVEGIESGLFLMTLRYRIEEARARLKWVDECVHLLTSDSYRFY